VLRLGKLLCFRSPLHRWSVPGAGLGPLSPRPGHVVIVAFLQTKSNRSHRPSRGNGPKSSLRPFCVWGDVSPCGLVSGGSVRPPLTTLLRPSAAPCHQQSRDVVPTPRPSNHRTVPDNHFQNGPNAASNLLYPTDHPAKPDRPSNLQATNILPRRRPADRDRPGETPEQPNGHRRTRDPVPKCTRDAYPGDQDFLGMLRRASGVNGSDGRLGVISNTDGVCRRREIEHDHRRDLPHPRSRVTTRHHHSSASLPTQSTAHGWEQAQNNRRKGPRTRNLRYRS